MRPPELMTQRLGGLTALQWAGLEGRRQIERDRHLRERDLARTIAMAYREENAQLKRAIVTLEQRVTSQWREIQLLRGQCHHAMMLSTMGEA